jgi:hypothetical protein
MSSEEDDLEVSIDKLIEWLADKPEDVWLDCVDRVNWDEGAWILLAITSHAHCTKQIAARIFWSAGPDELALEILKGGKINLNREGDMVIDCILRNWHAGLYRTGSIAFNGSTIAYSDYIRRLGPQADPLDIPEELFGEFVGRTPHVHPSMTPEANPQVWDLYYPVGLAYLPRPEPSANVPTEHPQQHGSEGDRPQSRSHRRQSPENASDKNTYRAQNDLVRSRFRESLREDDRKPEPQRKLGFALIAFALVLGLLLYWLDP